MSMMGGMAVASYIEEVKRFLIANADKTAEERLRLLIKKMNEDKVSAESGWL